MVPATEAALTAAAAVVAPKRVGVWDVLIPILIAAVLLGAIVAMALATTVFAADPMAGT